LVGIAFRMTRFVSYVYSDHNIREDKEANNQEHSENGNAEDDFGL